MVISQATIKRDGIQDWVSIRATAIIMTVFSLYMAWFYITTDSVSYEVWTSLFSGVGMKVFTLATLVSVMIHVRIGLWQV